MTSLNATFGVSQGESISPFLFYITQMIWTRPSRLYWGFQGITEGAFNFRSLIYADDVLLLPNSHEDLQAGLDCFYDYCLKWKLHGNTTKTSIMIFRKGVLHPMRIIFSLVTNVWLFLILYLIWVSYYVAVVSFHKHNQT